MDNLVFNRYELKYILTKKQYADFMAVAGSMLSCDPHGESTVQSLYYDTADKRLIRKSLEKPSFKEKIRLRSYGLVNNDGNAFLELKRKYDGIVYKRRINVCPNQMEDILKGNTPNGQIANEINSFVSFYNDLKPSMLLLYDRTAYYGTGDLRITFDRNIRYRENRLTLDAGLDGTPLLNDDEILMEIKIGTAFPLWLARLLTKEKIVKTSFSKYGTAYEKTFCERKNNSPVLIYKNDSESREKENEKMEVKKVG